jgi:large subunit ribosomal protein L31e
MRAIKTYVRKSMGTTDVRLDPSLNKYVWSSGIKSVPSKVRLIITRKKSDGDSKLKKPFCTVNALIVPTFDKLKTKRLESQ